MPPISPPHWAYRPGTTLSPASTTGNPGGPGAMGYPRNARPWKDTDVSTSAKPQPSAEAREEAEQARRALQTSLDTRQ